MVKLTGVDLETWLILFVRYGISYFGTKHKLSRLHEVIHDILLLRQQCGLIHEIEKDFFISGDLNSHISFDEVNLTSHIFKLMVLGPETSIFVDLEEENGA